MNWEVLGATGEWAGALVVVATLFFLAKQIGLSNRIALAEGDRVFMAVSYTHLTLPTIYSV